MLNSSGPVRRATSPLLAAIVMAAALAGARAAGQGAVPAKPQPPRALRLYVLDCGVLEVTNEGVERYHVTPVDVGETRMSVPCFLIAHPKGTLMWDLGVIPDDEVEAQGQKARSTVNPTVAALVTRTLGSQLAQLGHRPQDITYFAISHAHIDHSANMNMFASSTWLARPAERDFMYAEGNARVRPAFYTALKGAKSVTMVKDEHDVFGDGRVVIKAAPGHTPGHQVLVLRLASTGRVMLSGDLYHYPQERTLHSAPPDNEFNVQQSAASRVMIEEYLQKTKTALWIEHDFPANARLKKAPDFYE